MRKDPPVADTEQIAPSITGTHEWAAVAQHHAAVAPRHLRDLFADDPGRVEALTTSGADLVMDYSKHRITRDTVPLLTSLARRAGLPERIEAMFTGVHINTSEDRAVLHTALRAPRELALAVDGQDVPTEVHTVLGRMGEFTDAVRSGEWTGHTGERIRAVVNIGIGGSDLGPVMAYEATVT
jgi:glucose-6-phosphate isomerase